MLTEGFTQLVKLQPTAEYAAGPMVSRSKRDAAISGS